MIVALAMLALTLDPCAVAQRHCRAMQDVANWTACVSGPGTAYGDATCGRLDQDGDGCDPADGVEFQDGDIDLHDWHEVVVRRFAE